MKNKLIFFVILLPLFSFNVFDLGSPTINAICRIELNDGNIVEGMLVIVSGGYEGFRKNGFGTCYEDNDNFNYDLFTMDDYRFTAKSSSSRYNSVTNKYIYPEKYFLAAQRDNGETRESLFHRESGELAISVSRKYNYLVLKSFHIYYELPVSLYLPLESKTSDSKLRSKTINVDDIVKFQLIKEPSYRWTTLIQETRAKRDAISEEWTDYMEPIWYHENRNSTDFDQISKALGSKSTIKVYRDY